MHFPSRGIYANHGLGYRPCWGSSHDPLSILNPYHHPHLHCHRRRMVASTSACRVGIPLLHCCSRCARVPNVRLHLSFCHQSGRHHDDDAPFREQPLPDEHPYAQAEHHWDTPTSPRAGKKSCQSESHHLPSPDDLASFDLRNRSYSCPNSYCVSDCCADRDSYLEMGAGSC